MAFFIADYDLIDKRTRFIEKYTGIRTKEFVYLMASISCRFKYKSEYYHIFFKSRDYDTMKVYKETESLIKSLDDIYVSPALIKRLQGNFNMNSPKLVIDTDLIEMRTSDLIDNDWLDNIEVI